MMVTTTTCPKLALWSGPSKLFLFPININHLKGTPVCCGGKELIKLNVKIASDPALWHSFAYKMWKTMQETTGIEKFCGISLGSGVTVSTQQ